MSSFEVRLVCTPFDEEVEDRLVNEVDAMVGGHGGLVLVTMTQEASNGLTALMAATQALQGYGIVVERAVDDLVTRNQIADRAGKTPQAVGAWVRGDRRANEDFPRPFLLAAGGLWRWSNVRDWLVTTGNDVDDVFDYPTSVEIDRFNAVRSITAERFSMFSPVVNWVASAPTPQSEPIARPAETTDPRATKPKLAAHFSATARHSGQGATSEVIASIPGDSKRTDFALAG